MQEAWVRSLGQEDPLEKEMATHSSVLAWRIPGTGEPVGLPSMGSQRVGHDWSDVAAAAVYSRQVVINVKGWNRQINMQMIVCLFETKVIYYSMYLVVIQERRNRHSIKISEPYSMNGDLKDHILFSNIFK